MRTSTTDCEHTVPITTCALGSSVSVHSFFTCTYCSTSMLSRRVSTSGVTVCAISYVSMMMMRMRGASLPAPLATERSSNSHSHPHVVSNVGAGGRIAIRTGNICRDLRNEMTPLIIAHTHPVRANIHSYHLPNLSRPCRVTYVDRSQYLHPVGMCAVRTLEAQQRRQTTASYQ